MGIVFQLRILSQRGASSWTFLDLHIELRNFGVLRAQRITLGLGFRV